MLTLRNAPNRAAVASLDSANREAGRSGVTDLVEEQRLCGHCAHHALKTWMAPMKDPRDARRAVSRARRWESGAVERQKPHWTSVERAHGSFGRGLPCRSRFPQRAIGSRKFVVDLPTNRPGPGWKRRLA